MEIWNAHCIRPQKKRFNHIAGIPNELYTDLSLRQFRWCPDPELLTHLEEAMKNISKY